MSGPPLFSPYLLVSQKLSGSARSSLNLTWYLVTTSLRHQTEPRFCESFNAAYNSMLAFLQGAKSI